VIPMTTADLIKQHGGQRAAAKALGIPRSTLQSRLYKEQRDKDAEDFFIRNGVSIKDYMGRNPSLLLGGEIESSSTTFRVNESETVVENGHKSPLNPAQEGVNALNGPQVANRGHNGKQTIVGKRKTVLFLYDVHLPNESAENIALALDYTQARHEVDTVVIGGDLLDATSISRFKKDPYETMPLHDEIAYAVNWLDALRKRFAKSHIVLLAGNHEARLQAYLWTQAAEISKLKGLKIPDQLELDRFNIEWVDNLDRVQRGGNIFSIGKLNILHGNELGICPNINPARQYFLRALDNMICGHVHKVDDHVANTVAGKQLGAWVCGHLQNEHPAYRPLNPWCAGFAVAHFDADGLFSVKLKKIIEGRVL
jgi:hypothetical protein